MLYDIFQLYIFWFFIRVFYEVIIVKYRDKEKSEYSRCRESPNDRPSKSAPHGIRSDDKTSKNCSNTCENNGNKSFFRTLNNSIDKSFSLFHELIYVIDENDGISDDDSAESNCSNHRGCREVFSPQKIEDRKSWKYSKER